jgi:hypothetical protein
MLTQFLSRHRESECNNAELGAEAVTNSVCFPEIGLTDAKASATVFIPAENT